LSALLTVAIFITTTKTAHQLQKQWGHSIN